MHGEKSDRPAARLAHYGEQWGHHWLDGVRFSESDAYEYDTHRPDAYRYRDYVVRSFNEDKPYNGFLKELRWSGAPRHACPLPV